MPYRRSALVQERLDSARDRIATSALDLVAHGGWAACTVAAVAQRAGVATGTVYSHFPSKSALCAEVFRLAAGREVEAVRAVVEPPVRAQERVGAIVELFANRALRAPRLARALLAEPVEEAVDAERFRYRRAHRDLLARVLREGVEAGELPAQDVDVVAAALVGAIAEAVVVPLGRRSAPRPSVDALRTFALLAVGVQPLSQGGPRARHS